LKFTPRVRFTKTFRLSAIWSQSAVKKLLAVVDRKTSIGKRNYAIILLVSKLGLRIGDVLNLRIENVDWRKAIIHISQQKTKKALALPMSEDIGNALIDYLINGRPSTSSRCIFVAHCAPYGILKRPGFLNQYRKKAGIILPEASRQSWHSLRYSLATKLHEESTPMSVIAAILGHTSIESTRLYAKSNIEMLRSIALEWEGN
jgi:integrase